MKKETVSPLNPTRIAAVRAQLEQARQPTEVRGSPDYVSKYREFKYEETLFEIYARQYESSRADEPREGALIQVVDPASPPERKSKPKRALTAAIAALVVFVLLAGITVARHNLQRSSVDSGVPRRSGSGRGRESDRLSPE